MALIAIAAGAPAKAQPDDVDQLADLIATAPKAAATPRSEETATGRWLITVPPAPEVAPVSEDIAPAASAEARPTEEDVAGAPATDVISASEYKAALASDEAIPTSEDISPPPSDDIAPPAEDVAPPPEETAPTDETMTRADEAIQATEQEPAPGADDADPAGEDDSAAFEDVAVSEDAVMVSDWVIATGDNAGLPFVVIDKVRAQVFVFDADAQFLGVTPALLGSARGDESVEGIGNLKLSAIKPEDRTTPAGRFMAAFGFAKGDRKVLWVDYEHAVSLHPVVYANKKERRLERLVSPSPKDNRITYGCINVSQAFYDRVVRPLFTGTEGVVYILPETKPLDEVFPTLRAQMEASLHPAGSP